MADGLGDLINESILDCTTRTAVLPLKSSSEQQLNTEAFDVQR